MNINQWLQSNGMAMSAQNGARAIDINSNPYFGGEQNGANGGQTLGSGTGSDFMDWGQVPGIDSFYRGGVNAGDSSTDSSIDKAALDQWLRQNGYTIKESDVVGQWGGRPANWVRWIEDANGNIVGAPTAIQNTSSSDLRNVAMIGAMALGGAAANGGFGYGTFNPAPGAVGATGGAGATAGGGGLAATGSSVGEVGMLSTEGLQGLSTAALPESTFAVGGTGTAAGGAAAGAAGGGGGGAAAGGAGGGLTSAETAALYGNSGYGAGMSGAQTGAFDAVLGATGSTSLATGASNLAGAWDWLSTIGDAYNVGSNLFSNPLLNTLIGSGIQQWNIERAAQEQRDWQERQERERRARQAPVGMLQANLTVNRGTRNGN